MKRSRTTSQRKLLLDVYKRQGAAKAASIKNVEVIAYDELGCESVKRLTVENFSAIVSQDCVGGNLYTEGVAKYKK